MYKSAIILFHPRLKSSKIILLHNCHLSLNYKIVTKVVIVPGMYFLLLDRSPAFLTSDDFVRSNEIIRTKRQNVVIGHFVLMISSERKKSR